jgi:hypothetical protein
MRRIKALEISLDKIARTWRYIFFDSRISPLKYFPSSGRALFARKNGK